MEKLRDHGSVRASVHRVATQCVGVGELTLQDSRATALPPTQVQVSTVSSHSIQPQQATLEL